MKHELLLIVFFFSVSGKWTLFSVVKVVESTRLTGMNNGFFFFPELIQDGSHIFFVASSKFSFSKEARMIRDNIWGYKTPFRFVTYLSHVGKTSFTVLLDMYDHNSGLQILSFISKVVCVAKETRKPAKLPDWFVKKVQQFLQSKKIQDQSTDKMDIVVIPSDAFRFEVQALQSDCDSNFHVNHGNYLKWCTDAGAMAVAKGRYKYFTEDISLYALESVFVQYTGEVLRNEKVDVYTWEDKEEPRTLYFSMVKDSDLVVSAKLKYYESVPAGARAAAKL